MPRILTIWLPRWPVQRRLRESPELRYAPLFVCRHERRGVMRVVAWAWAVPARGESEASRSWSRPAERRRPAARIVAGMSLAEALSVLAQSDGSRACHRAEIVADDPVADREGIEEVARWCRRFAPLVAVESAERPECVHVDVTGTAEFFGGEETLVRTAVWTLQARGIHARAAIADTIGAGWAAARHTNFSPPSAGHPAGHPAPPARQRRCAIVPPADQMAALAHLPAAALRLESDCLARLREVGIDTIGGVGKLPRKSLTSRFGPQLARRLAQCSGTLAEPLETPSGGELPQASQAFDFPLLLRELTQEALGALVQRLVEACMAPLAAAGKGVTALQVRLESGRSRAGQEGAWDGAQEGAREACAPTVAPTVIDVGLFRPSAAVGHLAELVRLRMARAHLPREISGMVVDVVAVGPVAARQRMLFGEVAETAASQVGPLLDRLSGRLGRSAIFEPKLLADAQPEHAWLAVPPAASGRLPAGGRQASGTRGCALPAGGRFPERRPICLLPRPVRLEAVAVVPDGPPVRFQYEGQTHDIAQARGPERIETAWWRGPCVRRDYYVVDTSAGDRYWLFRRLQDGGWFLHGRFA